MELTTNADKLALGLETTGLGLLVTFVALVFLIVIISVLAAIMKERKKLKAALVANDAPAPTKQVAEPTAPKAAQGGDDTELIAVLTAAATAYMQGQAGAAASSGLVIRSYRKVNGTSAWATAGRNAQIYNKF